MPSPNCTIYVEFNEGVHTYGREGGMEGGRNLKGGRKGAGGREGGNGGADEGGRGGGGRKDGQGEGIQTVATS